MKTKFLSLVVMAIFALSVLAYASQKPNKQGQKANIGKVSSKKAFKARPMNLFEKLNLTKEQNAKIKTIMQDNRKEFEAIGKNSLLKPDQKREKMQSIRKSSFAKIFALLTPDQKTKMEQMRKQNRSWKKPQK